MTEQLTLFAEAETSANRASPAARFAVRPAPLYPYATTPSAWYVMDSLYCFRVVATERTEAEAEAKADELEERHS